MPQNVKRKYEAMFLVDSAVATAEWDSVVGAINKIMDRADAELISLNKWDERRLCQEVKKRKRGTYILCYFNGLPSAIKGIERDVQISEALLRVLILNAENIPNEILNRPTPAMKAARRKEAAEEKGAIEKEASEDNKPAVTDDASAVEAVVQPLDVEDTDINNASEDTADINESDTDNGKITDNKETTDEVARE